MSEVNPPATKRRPDGAALVIAPVLFLLAVVIWWDASRLSMMSNYARIGPATLSSEALSVRAADRSREFERTLTAPQSS